MPRKVDLNPRRQPEQARSRKRVNASLDAAARLITERGIDRVSMTDIASEAGMSKAALYRYFPNKTALVRALVVEAHVRDRAWCEAHLAEDGDPMTTLMTSFRALAEEVFTSPYRTQLRAAIHADVELAELDYRETLVIAGLITDFIGDAVPMTRRKLELQVLLVLELFDRVLMLAERMPDHERDVLVDTYLGMVRGLFGIESE